jgi:hemerythrin-like metal-binding protein/PAS domain S-box-containing protein
MEFFNNLNIKIKLFAGFSLIFLIFLWLLLWQFTALDKIDKNQTVIENTNRSLKTIKRLKLISLHDLQGLLEIIRTENPAAIDEIVNGHIKVIVETQSLYDSLYRQTRILYPNKNDMTRIKIINYLDDTKSIIKNILQPYFENTEKIKKDQLEKGDLFRDYELASKENDSIPEDSIEAITTVEFIGLTGSTRKAQLDKIYQYYKQNHKEIAKKFKEIERVQSELLYEAGVDLKYQSQKIKVYNSLFVVLAIITIFFITLAFSRTISEPLKTLKNISDKLSKGQLPDEIPVEGNDEIGKMAGALKALTQGLQRTSAFAIEMGKANFSSEFKPLSESDVLGNALLNMRKSLQAAKEDEEKRKIEDQQRRWTTEGLAQFGEILRRHTENINLLSKDIISSLIKYLNANQGGIFILNDSDEKDIYLELIAAYAYNREKFFDKRINPGEGLVGGVAVEKYTIYLTDLPEEYIDIESGLGDANPKSLLIVPLKLEDEVLGVIEIASFNEFKQYEIELVERIGESIASTLSTAKINTRTAELLEQSRVSEQEMQEQEEKMRQDIEEITKSQKDALARESELRREVEDLENMRINFIDRDKRQRQRLQELTTNINERSESLETIESQLNKSFEENLNPVIQFDETRKIKSFNKAAETLWGYSKSEVLGRDMYVLTNEETARDFEERISLYFKTGRNDLIKSILDAFIKSKEGVIVPVQLSMTEIDLKRDKSLVIFIKDLGKLQALEQDRNVFEERLMAKEFDFSTKINFLENFIKENNLTIPKDLEKRSDLIKWNEDYSIDLNIIDQQHKKWIDFINILYRSFKNEVPVADINENISKLLDYTDYHFGFEEKYLEDFNCGKPEEHKKIHEKFINTIKEYQIQFNQGKNNSVYKLIVFINSWVLHHIQVEDKSYVDCFKLNGLS